MRAERSGHHFTPCFCILPMIYYFYVLLGNKVIIGVCY